MTNEELMKEAQALFLNGAGRKDVISFLTSNGMATDEVDGFTTNAYKSIKEQRAELLKEQEKIAKSEGRKDGLPNIVIGVVIFVILAAVVFNTGKLYMMGLVAGFCFLAYGLFQFFGKGK